MQQCPNCGRYLPDAANACGSCGTRLRMLSETHPDSVPAASEPAAEATPTKAGRSRKALMAVVIAAALLLIGGGLLAFFLTRGAPTTVLRKSTYLYWSEENGSRKVHGDYAVDYDERGLMIGGSGTYGSSPFSISATYTLDEHRNPVSVTVTQTGEGTSRTDTVTMNCEYDGAAIIRVAMESVTDGSLSNAINPLDAVLNFSGYENALLMVDGFGVQLDHGHLARRYDGTKLVYETTHSGDYPVRTVQWVSDGRRRIETVYDERTLVTSVRFVETGSVEGDENETWDHYRYVADVDTEGKPCLIRKTEGAESESADAYTETGRYYLGGNGHVARAVTESWWYTHTVEYDDRGRVILEVTEFNAGGETKHEEHIFEYR